MSVRFLGRRVYSGLAVVLMSVKKSGTTATEARLSQMLAVPVRTLKRWREWWVRLFPATPLWQGACARFMPQVATGELPLSLIERFSGLPEESMMRLLTFLSPLTVRH